jgi:hypothetical protein
MEAKVATDRSERIFECGVVVIFASVAVLEDNVLAE